jgi:hypothetical protein
MAKDLSYKQFMEALTRHGMKWTGVMGYVEIGFGTSCSILNVPGKNNRRRLAYLLEKQEEAAKQNEERLARHAAFAPKPN